MSDPLAEREEKGPSVGEFFSKIGTFLIILSAFILINIGFQAFSDHSPSEKFNFAMLLSIGAGLIFLSILTLLHNKIKIQINEIVYAIFALVILTFAIFLAPGKQMAPSTWLPSPPPTYTVFVQGFNAIGIIGALIVLIAKKPNFGPEANRRIYQATGGWIGTIMALVIILLGLYMTYGFDITQYAGNGRYPGGKMDFFDAFLSFNVEGLKNAKVFWFNIYGLNQVAGQSDYIPGMPYDYIWPVGWTVMIGAAIIFLAAVLRNRINLKIASGVLISGIVVALVGLSQFDLAFRNLDSAMRNFYVVEMYPPMTDVYEQQLKLHDPGLFLFGIVLILIEFVALFFIIYASFSAKPIDKWMMRRDRYIAAAEVATKEGKLESAMKYLELAAEWSSKVDEEDKAVELLTKVRQIEKKAIQMKKAKAAEEAKKHMKDDEGKDKKATEKKYKEVSEKEQAGTKKSEHVAKQEGADEEGPTSKTPK